MKKHDLTEPTLNITFESLSILNSKINYKGGWSRTPLSLKQKGNR